MGANAIKMARAAQLGPVDPSREHPLLPKTPDGKAISISVQDLRHCMAFIRREAGDSLDGDSFSKVIAALFREVHPLAIGSLEEAYALGRLVTKKMLEMHMDPAKDEGKINGIVEQMSDGFKSHAFAFGYREAKRIGLKAEQASSDLEKAINEVTFSILNVQLQSTATNVPGGELHFMGAVMSASSGSSFQMQLSSPAANSTPTRLEPVGTTWIYLPPLATGATSPAPVPVVTP